VRRATARLAGFSPAMEKKNRELKRFLYENMYKHRRVRRMEFKARLYLTELFQAYLNMPELLPEPVVDPAQQGSLERRICDYVSGMTDRYAIEEYKQLFLPEADG
jgi:dGTPase